MSRRGHEPTNVNGRPRHKLFKLIVPEARAKRAMARFSRAERRARTQREIDAVRTILLRIYPHVSQEAVARANGWPRVVYNHLMAGTNLSGAGKLAARILDELATLVDA